MKTEAQVCINASREEIWQVISDIDNSADTIAGIEKVEVLERPESGLMGLKWRETRTMFGQTATEVMWITDAVENQFYQTRAESHGAVYVSRMQIAERDGETCLIMSFTGVPQNFFARVMAALTGWMTRASTKKALQADLEDIKAAVEAA